MWLEQGATFKRVAERFAADPDALPSDFVPQQSALQSAHEVLRDLKAAGVNQFGVRFTTPGTTR